jgi:D-alanyl-D-alanine dipeptidase
MKPANSFPTTAFAAMAVAALAACTSASSVAPVAQTPASPVETTTLQAPAAAQPIAATLRIGTLVAASPRADAVTCAATHASVRAIRFESGRFLVSLSADDVCANRLPDRSGWVDPRNVTLADEAYAPALARVSEQPALKIAMNYVGSKIFCDAQQRCRINEALYANARCYAAPRAAEALAKAAQTLRARDQTLSLKVLDCYRPIYVQERMYALVADPKWVARPKPPRYGGHNRAVAIDLTLEKNGVELDMGTPFDAFDEKSEWHDDGRGITAQQQANRRLLRELMIGAGFRPYDGEWWHFSLPIDTPALNHPL